MKARKLFFLVALVAMVMALTSCGLSSDKQGTYCPAKVVYDVKVKADNSSYATENTIIDWEHKTVKINGVDKTYYDVTPSQASIHMFNIKATKAKTNKGLSSATFAADGKDGIEWDDSDYEVKEENGAIVLGIKVIGVFTEWYKLEPSDDSNYRYMITGSGDLSGGGSVPARTYTYKAYYNKY